MSSFDLEPTGFELPLDRLAVFRLPSAGEAPRERGDVLLLPCFDLRWNGREGRCVVILLKKRGGGGVREKAEGSRNLSSRGT